MLRFLNRKSHSAAEAVALLWLEHGQRIRMLSREGRRRSRAEIAATLAIPTRACVERLVTNRPRGDRQASGRQRRHRRMAGSGIPFQARRLSSTRTQARAIVCGLPGPSLAPGDRFPRPGHGRPHPRGTRRLPKPPARASPAMIGTSWNFRSGTQRRRRTSCPCGNHGAVPMRIMRPGTQQRRVIGDRPVTSFSNRIPHAATVL
jgi:hypothetical protein